MILVIPCTVMPVILFYFCFLDSSKVFPFHCNLRNLNMAISILQVYLDQSCLSFLILLPFLYIFTSLWFGWLINFSNDVICVESNDLSIAIRDLFYNVRNVTTKAEGKRNPVWNGSFGVGVRVISLFWSAKIISSD